MCAVGLIVEYNPFHNGHLYHLNQSKAITGQDAVVAVMSGHFLQRGEPALLDKWSRTELALKGGCDLVLELPVAYATSSAEWFAYGAVALLEATGIVSDICFGTESGQLQPLFHAANMLADEPLSFSEKLNHHLKNGLTFPTAYSKALTEELRNSINLHEEFRFDLPNHTLGLHYLIALRRLQSSIKPHTIAREKAQYSETSLLDKHIASATAIRKQILQAGSLQAIQSFVPATTYEGLQHYASKNKPFMSWEHFFSKLVHQIVTQTPDELKQYREIQEGLENRIKSSLPSLATSQFDSLLNALKTKRYTQTKLQRALLAILLNHTKQRLSREALQSGISYIRVLGFNEKGQQLLKQMKKTAKLPIVHSPKQLKDLPFMLELDIQATGVYMLAQPGQQDLQSLILDYILPPIRL